MGQRPSPTPPVSVRRREPAAIVAGVLAGDVACAGRALSIVIDERAGYEELSRSFFVHAGKAHKIGVSGPPGSGKSSLINRLVAQYRKAGERIGILAVDPTSPFTGGAFLGDRLRVQQHAMDSGVFFRSLGSRGTIGGLTSTIFSAIHVLEAWGCERILLETVGTGQDEVEIAHVADTVLYVTTPSLGDEIQAMKAGAMEAADVLVLNKSDLAEKDKALAALQEALGLGGRETAGWTVKVVAASAAKSDGIGELVAAVDEHRAWLKSSGRDRARAKDQLRMELSLLVARRVTQNALGSISESQLEDLLSRRTDPVTLGAHLAASPRLDRSMDHVGVAVEDIKTAVRFYQDSLGLEIVHEETVPLQKVRVVFLAAPGAGPGECQVELLEPTADDGAVAQFLDKRGPGIHHIAFHTRDMKGEFDRLTKAGTPPLDVNPRPGSRGHQVCFLHPKHAHGVLVELVG
ncbi:MAG: methylmalonyl Co-A mutase-associated GTPase MeaB [Elusimicrobia bacterium]|nr:methylmalonyl Co-A mutase-associated GTPase MeaB [Elusimicrobiota bacterium]